MPYDDGNSSYLQSNQQVYSVSNDGRRSEDDRLLGTFNLLIYFDDSIPCEYFEHPADDRTQMTQRPEFVKYAIKPITHVGMGAV
uniref:DUF1330 domain-containing protein n=1 Tax=Angiostrongylus cantonensis TaxID=6313 RepID=A0A0K0DC30_ANGCA